MTAPAMTYPCPRCAGPVVPLRVCPACDPSIPEDVPGCAGWRAALAAATACGDMTRLCAILRATTGWLRVNPPRPDWLPDGITVAIDPALPEGAWILAGTVSADQPGATEGWGPKAGSLVYVRPLGNPAYEEFWPVTVIPADTPEVTE